MWIDKGCSSAVEVNLQVACDKLFDATGIDMEIGGRKSIDALDPNEGLGIQCLPARRDGVLGRGGEAGIRLYGVDHLSTIMHELGHVVGMAHNDDPNSVMFPVNRGVTEYTSKDTEGMQ